MGLNARWLLATLVLGISIVEGWPQRTSSQSSKADAQPIARPVVVRVLDDLSGKRLALFRDGKELGSLSIPVTLSATAVEDGLGKVLLHPNGNDVAAGFQSQKGSFVAIFLLQKTGSYLGVDVSAAERVNVGGIGPHRNYKSMETVPTGWLSRPQNDDAVQVWLQTRAWDLSGQRYTIREPLIIKRDGTVLWR